ncbi:methyl-accepting chemotaxis protein [Pelagibacterium sp. 26DY04]|uniref:methyl-accepting chemotaxis protein n=1 Tax=Pelagibacterium sp. 26DY04 TaxID=2967130 RepID=UPI002815DFE1|nr:methyl-accepting chemotaxis protein [Pelagibacterium sp. 26DY04]WMT88030.1 methyl-accepting chemotaxis protein [Pelagibacterium sp. 26DY04]
MLKIVTGSIGRRMSFLLVMFVVGLVALASFQLSSTHRNLIELKKQEIQSVVQASVSMLDSFNARVQSGELTLEEAQTQAKAALTAINYSGDDYVFAVTHDYIMVVNQNPDVVDTNMRDRTDSNGKRFIEEYTDGARLNGSIFTTFGFSGNGEIGEVDKLTYVQNYAPWEWAIGTGVLQTDIDAIYTNNVITSGGIAIAIIAFLSVAGWLLSRSLTKPINALNAQMVQIADNQFDVEVTGTGRADELGTMARAVEVFRENGKKVAEMTEAEAARIFADQKARTEMMAELQQAFGDVVDAAIAGDFSKRVPAKFPDAELNALAGSVNTLVETVDEGLDETSQVLGALANTDLTRRMEGNYQGAFSKLKSDINSVADKLGEIVGQLRETSNALKLATSEILSGANDLSERTIKQAATIEETSAAMEQLATTVVDNAKKAGNASEKANAVSRAAEEGGQVMTDANHAMERITTSSAKISNIIGMIDDIAFQTNLLALNASVEAARAGEAGKGFAVVAVEVRRLAQSSAEASSEVKALIDQSAMEVNAGTKLVAEAAGKLSTMLEAIRATNTLMDGIARDSQEQAAAIEQVNVAVRQMDEMTQHNAALVEEINASIEQTERQAVELDRVVDVFTLTETRRQAEPEPAPAAGAKSLQQNVRTAAKTYLSHGNAAVKDDDWSEF